MTGALANGLSRLAVESDLSTEKLLSMIPGPIGAFIAVIILLTPFVTEVKGWTNGPLAKRVSAAAEKADQKSDERDQKWIDRDRRVTELEYVVKTMNTTVKRQGLEIERLHRLGDAQNAVLAEHNNWDRMAQAEVNNLGGNLPAPPPLYVYTPDDGATIPS